MNPIVRLNSKQFMKPKFDNMPYVKGNILNQIYKKHILTTLKLIIKYTTNSITISVSNNR